MSIGENIRKYRKLRNKTMKELGSFLGITEQAISQYERDIRTPNTKIVYKIAMFLEIQPELIDPELQNLAEFDTKSKKLVKEVKMLEVMENLIKLNNYSLSIENSNPTFIHISNDNKTIELNEKEFNDFTNKIMRYVNFEIEELLNEK